MELMKSSDKNKDEHCKTAGNSLFGEVDDRRMDVERKMISLKIKYESMERNHSTIKQQLKKMKVSYLHQYHACLLDMGLAILCRATLLMINVSNVCDEWLVY